jgi:undecaprenyl diphosphate synthase
VVVRPAAPNASEQADPSLPRLHAVPRHVALMMDGNGRWANARSLSRSDGHRAGADAIRPVIERMGAHGVGVLTFFGFSTENWRRPRDEVQALLRLASDFVSRYLDELDERGVQLRHLGDREQLPRRLQQQIKRAVDRTAENNRIVVNLAFNYGGRADIVAAVRCLVAEGVPASQITEEALACRLATAGLPEPDFVIRTGGERRLSNFLLWQAAYAELYFTETLWPDFGPPEVDAALVEYSRRHRRFGMVPGDLEDRPGGRDTNHR